MLQVGCRLPWDVLSSPQRGLCSTILQFRCPPHPLPSSREFEALYEQVKQLEIEDIVEVTACMVPCNFKQYKTVGQPTPSSEPSNYTFVGFWSISNSTFMEEEALIYPWTSLVAEFGGTLGLFLGVFWVEDGEG